MGTLTTVVVFLPIILMPGDAILKYFMSVFGLPICYTILASLLTDEPWWKDYGFKDEQEQLRLCAKDARITFQVWDALTRRLYGTVGT